MCDLESDLNAWTCALHLTPFFSHCPPKRAQRAGHLFTLIFIENKSIYIYTYSRAAQGSRFAPLLCARVMNFAATFAQAVCSSSALRLQVYVYVFESPLQEVFLSQKRNFSGVIVSDTKIRKSDNAWELNVCERSNQRGTANYQRGVQAWQACALRWEVSCCGVAWRCGSSGIPGY